MTPKAIFLDISGVLYVDNQIISGAREAIKHFRNAEIQLRFVTNTVSKDSQSIIQQLTNMAIDISEEELLTAPLAALNYIKQNQLRPFCLIHPAIKHEFDSIMQKDPNCVLLGDAQEELNYTNLNKAFQLCKQGAPLIGIGKNKYFQTLDGLKLDAGAFIHALEWAADQVAIIMGKPSPDFFAQVIASTPFTADECLMVGDDVLSDVQGAIDAGINAVLVRTGKFQPQDEPLVLGKARIIDSIADLPALIG